MIYDYNFKIGDRVKGLSENKNFKYIGTIKDIKKQEGIIGIKRDDKKNGGYYYNNFYGLWQVYKKENGSYGSNGENGYLLKLNVSSKLMDVKNKIIEKL